MVQTQRSTRAMVGADVSYVVQLLHDTGPLQLRRLGDDPVLAEWSANRIQDAVVSAWSQGLIFIDAQDMVVAL